MTYTKFLLNYYYYYLFMNTTRDFKYTVIQFYRYNSILALPSSVAYMALLEQFFSCWRSYPYPESTSPYLSGRMSPTTRLPGNQTLELSFMYFAHPVPRLIFPIRTSQVRDQKISVILPLYYPTLDLPIYLTFLYLTLCILVRAFHHMNLFLKLD